MITGLSDPFEYGGDKPFACEHCAGMGYLDYPSTTKPCPVPGHAERYKRNLSDIMAMMDGLRRPYSPRNGICPYCKALGRPVEIDCEHWSGLGWSKSGNHHFSPLKSK